MAVIVRVSMNKVIVEVSTHKSITDAGVDILHHECTSSRTVAFP
jgi:hypothetical protein